MNVPSALTSENGALDALKQDLLAVYKAVLALDKRVTETTVNTADVRPQLIALKVHSESIPQALREVRRSHAAIQKTIAEFDERLRRLESRVATPLVNP